MSDPAKLTSLERAQIVDDMRPVAVELAALDVADRNEALATVTTDVATLLVNGADKWSDDEIRHFIDKGWRTHREGEVPRISQVVRPADYEHDLKRGSVVHHDALRNYCFCAVFIPGGSVIRGRNFAQCSPGTDAITTDGPITLIDCNLINCRIDASWIVDNCNTAQAWRVIDLEKGERFSVICSHPDKLTGDEVPPDNALLTRDF